jgi:hypothetical protein
MNVRELRWGDAEALELRGTYGAFDPIPAVGKEARLVLLHDGVLLNIGNQAWGVVGATARAQSRIREAAAAGGACVVWVASANSDRALVEVRRFASEFREESAMHLRVDEATREAMQGVLGIGGTVPEIARTLEGLMLLPPRPGDPPSKFRAIVVARGGSERNAFRMVGVKASIDIERRATGYVVLRVVRGGPPRDAQAHVLFAPLKFVDASDTSALAASTRAELEAAVASSGSYLQIWRSYSEIDKLQTGRRAERFGAVRYRRAVQTQGGWKVELPDGDLAVLRLLDEDPDAHMLLSKDPPAPPPLTSDEPQRKPPRGKEDVVLQVVRCEERVLHLRPTEEGRQVMPLEQGWLSLSVLGDEKRIERREAAEQRIREGTGPMGARLGLLLEGRPTHAVNYRHRVAMSPTVREALGASPTERQIKAIDVALNTPDIAMIQGPPGTGKTSVIEAIERRVAELEEEASSVNHRILITSAQHDAVENVVTRTSVYGLPAVKVGHRRHGEGTSIDQVARFQSKQAELLRAGLGTIKESERLRRARELAVALMTHAGSAAQALETLREIRQQIDALIPGPLMDKLDAEIVRAARRRATSDEAERELLLRAVRGVRDDVTTFEDDGPVKARVALARLRAELRPDERALLQRCADWDEPGSPPWLAQVAVAKAQVLDRLLDAPTTAEGGIDDAARNVVVAVIDALRSGIVSRRTYEESVLANFLYDIETDPDGVGETLRDYTVVLGATLQQSASGAMYQARSISEGGLEFSTVIVDEAARAHPLDLFIPMSMARRRIVLVGDHRQLPHMLEPEVERELTAGLSDGDLSKETEDALKRSLFWRLWNLLEEQSRRDGIRRTVTLDAQFRMHPTLGAFVSEAFYERVHDPRITSPLPANNFAHGLQKFQRDGVEHVAAWADVSEGVGMEQRVGTSTARRPEARRVAALAKEILDADPSLSVGVISFYSAQVEHIRRELEREGILERDGERRRVAERYATGRDRRDAPMERFRVGSVDAFQGKEFDVVILSLTRSNTLPERTQEERRRKYGHLLLDNRLCVAMSRQRRLLITVGDLAFARRASVLVPIQMLISLCEGDHGTFL